MSGTPRLAASRKLLRLDAGNRNGFHNCMRGLIALAAVTLAGCVNAADPATFRSPSTPGELAQFEQYRGPIGAVMERMKAASADICPVDDRRCMPQVNLNAANGIGALASGGAIYMSLDMAAFLQNEHEISGVLGHEWAHILLGHSAFSPEQEINADCLGTLLAVRAGYNGYLASMPHDRMNAREDIQAVLLLSVGAFGGGAKVSWTRRFAMVRAASDAAQGHELNKANMQTICGVSF